MKSFILIFSFVATSSFAATNTPQTETTTTTQTTTVKASTPFKMIHVADLENMMQAEKGKVAVFDANTPKVRTQNGIIPGALLLTKASDYNVEKTLPADHAAPLVFYCVNTACTASHKAAARAVENKYTNVFVLTDGIQGWKKAGKATEKVPNKI